MGNLKSEKKQNAQLRPDWWRPVVHPVGLAAESPLSAATRILLHFRGLRFSQLALILRLPATGLGNVWSKGALRKNLSKKNVFDDQAHDLRHVLHVHSSGACAVSCTPSS